jgi:hypothetical protein
VAAGIPADARFLYKTCLNGRASNRFPSLQSPAAYLSVDRELLYKTNAFKVLRAEPAGPEVLPHENGI